MVGQKTKGDPKSPASLQVAATAVDLLNNGTYPQLGAAPFTLVKLEKIHTQVVAGMNYYLTMKLTDSSGAKVEVEVVMYATPTNPPINTLTSVKVLSGGPQKEGGLTKGDPKSTDSLQVAATAVDLLNAGSYPQLGKTPFTLVKLESIYTQVVAGMNYYLTMKLTDSTGAKVNTEVVMYSMPTSPPINTITSAKVIKG